VKFSQDCAFFLFSSTSPSSISNSTISLLLIHLRSPSSRIRPLVLISRPHLSHPLFSIRSRSAIMSYGGGGYGSRGGSNGYGSSSRDNYSSGYSGYENLRLRYCCEVGRISLSCWGTDQACLAFSRPTDRSLTYSNNPFCFHPL
jgi:hypothetical protein